MGQLFAPRAFGSKKCVVLAFVVRPFIHSRFEFTSAEASGNLGFPRGIVLVGTHKDLSSPLNLGDAQKVY